MLKTRPHFMDFVGYFVVAGITLGMALGFIFVMILIPHWFAIIFGMVFGGMLGFIFGFCDGLILFGVVRVFRLSPKQGIFYHVALMLLSAGMTMSVGYALFDAVLREWIALFDNYGAQTITLKIIGIAMSATIYTSLRMSRWHVRLQGQYASANS